MKTPVLVIMAAGMGSRFGGLKQIEPVSSKGEIILDFSLYDAVMAGFKKVIFVIKKENEDAFRELIDNRAGKYIDVEYAFQAIDDLPEGYRVPEGREKPWGTGHAVLAARDLVDAPFAVINADDYYGPGAFQTMYSFLENAEDNDKYQFCMVGFQIENTLTENGYVSRGVCQLSDEGYLTDITERTKIQWQDDKIVFTEDDGTTWQELPRGTSVSMNFWGFTSSMMKELKERFPAFLDKAVVENPMKGEYFLPGVVDQLIQEGKAEVKVLNSMDRWYGVTYKEDKESVVDALQSMKDKGEYPDVLWK
ncbi:MAG: sugar phosphate nucleotidyltransferase [Firmicutes bacterium]|nr:sugar phosphate nucleotidyltransferase [Bacillota bacterium]